MAYKGSIEPKLGMEQTSKPTYRKMSNYKVKSHYSSDRNVLAQIILDTDPEAIIKFRGDWAFKVRTKMTYSELFSLLVRAENRHYERPRMANLRKVWWF